MFRLAISSLKRRKLRIFLLALAIIISVGFLVAVIVVGDSLGSEVQTSSSEAEVNIAEIVRSLKYVLIGFNILGFLVGLFVIKNTFTVILAQRSKELAMLRTIGASKLSIFRLVIWEAFFVGLVGGLIGIAFGVALAAGALALGAYFDWGFEDISLSLSGHIFIWPLILGVFAAIFSSILPAIKASRQSPLQALTSNELLIKNIYKWRLIIGLLVLIIGILITLPAFFIDLTAADVAGSAPPLKFYLRLVSLFWGITFIFISFTLLSPIIAKLFARLNMKLFKGDRWLGWRLSASNIWRQPLRAATTANVLMIGVTLITIITVTLSSFRASTTHFIEQFLPYNWGVTEAFDEDSPFDSPSSDRVDLPESVFLELQAFHEDVIVYGQREAQREIGFAEDSQAKVDDGLYDIAGFDLDLELAEGFDLQISETEFENFEKGQLLVAAYLLRDNNLQTGDEVVLRAESSQLEKTLIVGGSFDRARGLQLLVNNSVYRELIGEGNYDSAVIVNNSNLDDKEVRVELESILEPHEGLALFGREDLIEIINYIFDIILSAFRVLLSLAFVVAITGLFNTLLLAIYERTREIGLLRSIGMSAGGLRRVISFEAVQIATLGVLLGTLLGTVFAWGIIEVTVKDVWAAQPVEEGDPVFEFLFHVPVKELLTVYGVALALALSAAFIPALKATRIKIIDALKHY